MTPENGTPEGAEKTPRHRSPNYPGISLKTAVEKITIWYKADGIVASSREAAMKHMGGDVGRVMSALKGFGLISEADGRVKLAQRGIDIVVRPADDPKRKQAIKEASLSPSIYSELVNEYSGGLPSDTTLQSELIAGRKFNPKAVSAFIKDFRDTLDFAGISPSDVVDSGEDDGEDATFHVGDYVQWESQGALKLPQSRRIQAFSEDGAWAFLDGSSTGISVKELIAMEPPTTEKPEIPVIPPPVLSSPEGVKKPGDTLKQLGQQPIPKMRSYAFPLSGDFSAKLELFGEAQSADDLDALADFVEITVKALKRSLKSTPPTQ